MSDTGRCIYIHENTMDALIAKSGKGAAQRIYTALATMALIKSLNNQVFEDGVMCGDVTAQSAAQVKAAITQSPYTKITALLREVDCCQRSRPNQRDVLLGKDEEITGSCFFSGYYTLATSPAMTDLMHRETRTIHEIRRLQQEKGEYKNWRFINQAHELNLLNQDKIQRSPLSAEKMLAVREKSKQEVEREFLGVVAALPIAESEKIFVTKKIVDSLNVFFSHKVGASCTL